MMRFAVVGMGGVGGSLGALMVHGGQDVAFIARGGSLAAIRESGLRFESGLYGAHTERPRLVTDDPAEAGIVDCVLLCTKSYGLPAALDSITPMVGPDTIVLSTLNGVGNAAYIRGRLARGTVIDGCIYILAERTAPGVVSMQGTRCRLVFGGDYDGELLARLQEVAGVLRGCGIAAEVTQDIEREIWNKYILIEGASAAQIYYGAAQGQITAHAERLHMLAELFEEGAAVGRAAGVAIDPALSGQLMEIFATFAPGSTTSLQRDVQAGRESEWAAFTPRVVALGRQLGVPVPQHEKVLAALS